MGYTTRRFTTSTLTGTLLLGLSIIAAGCSDSADAPSAAAVATDPAPRAADPAGVDAADPASEAPAPGLRTATGDVATPPTLAADDAPREGATNDPEAAGGTPQITFAKAEHDFGTIDDVGRVYAEFPFTNTGTAELVIKEVKGSCGCTVPTLEKRRFMPGEGDVIKASFDPKGRPGTQTKYITVISNDARAANHRLKITSQVEPLLAIDRTLNLGIVPLGEKQVRELEMTYSDPEIDFISITTNNPHLQAELVSKGDVATTEGGTTRYKALLELTLDEEAPWGVLFTNRVSIRARVRPEPDATPIIQPYTINVVGRVFGDVHANPQGHLALGTIKAGDTFEKSMLLTRQSGEMLEITGFEVVESTFDGIEIKTEQVSDDSVRIVLSGDTTDFKGSIRGIVSVKTPIENEDDLRIRFTGYAKP